MYIYIHLYAIIHTFTQYTYTLYIHYKEFTQKEKVRAGFKYMTNPMRGTIPTRTMTYILLTHIKVYSQLWTVNFYDKDSRVILIMYIVS